MGRDSKCRQVFLLCESSEKKKKKKPGRKKEYRESTPSEKVMFQMTLNKKKNVSVSGHIANSSEIDKFIKYPQGRMYPRLPLNSCSIHIYWEGLFHLYLDRIIPVLYRTMQKSHLLTSIPCKRLLIIPLNIFTFIIIVLTYFPKERSIICFLGLFYSNTRCQITLSRLNQLDSWSWNRCSKPNG